ncbi:winged helix DNA-binding domain-containing protein [Streptomyces uncialis]|uniref:winged helix DNA-binding domain-containing protein n=1 Tax=Streptomyces uncialis TaxID=1048205 RepID=UPI0038703A89|nr:winged helix DNA-binding domain-containing protein [Streptomyces uncialis]
MTTTRNSGARRPTGPDPDPDPAPDTTAGTGAAGVAATSGGAAGRSATTRRGTRTPSASSPGRRTASAPAPVLSDRALGRATLARQYLLAPAAPGTLTVAEALTHLVGLQAQNVKPPYYGLAARIEDFDPRELSASMENRAAVRIVTMRSTIHTHTATDALTLRSLVQPALERELHGFRAGLVGVDQDRLVALSRDLVESEPRTMAQLREVLLKEWPDADPLALSLVARCRLPLVQVTPRGLWRRSGQVALTTVDRWLGRPLDPEPSAEDAVRRYLAAFGPASVKDMQTWARLTRLKEVFERLRPELLTFRDERGTELFDLPDAPHPDADTEAPPRLLPEYDNLLLSHADRSRVVPAEYKGLTWQGNYAYRVLMTDGLVAGVWKLEENADSAVLTIEPFAPLGRGRRETTLAEGERVLRLLAEPSVTHEVRFGAVRRT